MKPRKAGFLKNLRPERKKFVAEKKNSLHKNCQNSNFDILICHLLQTKKNLIKLKNIKMSLKTEFLEAGKKFTFLISKDVLKMGEIKNG